MLDISPIIGSGNSSSATSPTDGPPSTDTVRLVDSHNASSESLASSSALDRQRSFSFTKDNRDSHNQYGSISAGRRDNSDCSKTQLRSQYTS